MQNQYQIIVIGGGPGGYVAAIRAAQLGFSVACVEAWKDQSGKPRLGGTCLNVGCIPSKALLESSARYHEVLHDLAKHGIKIEKASIDVATMQERKEDIVNQLTSGIDMLFKANKIDWIQAHGKLLPNKEVELSLHDGEKKNIKAEKAVILALGSLPIDIPVAPMDGERIVSSTGALSFTDVPKRLGVIGAGVIGLELGSVWHALGAEVVVLEAMEHFLLAADAALAKEAEKHFTKQGLDIRLGAKVTSAEVRGDEVLVEFEYQGESQQITVDKLLVAVGRKANTQNAVDEACGISFDQRGLIEVDQYCYTGVDGIYAIGDCVRGPMLAHKASEEGVMVAERIADQEGEVDYNLIPSVIYTHPEIAWVGKTEEELKEAGIEYKKGDFPFAANGRAKAANAASGFVKILADAQTDEILGAHIIGPCASEMIHELIVAMAFYGAAEDIGRIMHAHPTLSESIHEAALAVNKEAIHKANR